MIVSRKEKHKLPERSPYWFYTKKYGWGWTPVTWQGWLVVMIYFYVFIAVFISIDSRSNSMSDTLINSVVPLSLATLIAIGVCYRTGEKPMWRWGKTSKKNNRKSYES